MKKAPEYNWSDAWLLLAVIYAASSADPQPHSNNLHYPEFTNEAYTEAVNNYLARHRR